MKRLILCSIISAACFASALAQTPAKPAPDYLTAERPKGGTAAERYAARDKKMACQKQAKDQKFKGRARRSFIKACIAK